MSQAPISSQVEGFYAKNVEQGYADDYDNQHGARVQWVIDAFGLDKLHGQRILDVGCGRGNFFKRLPPDNTFVGLDGAKIGHGGKLCPFLSLRVDLSQPFAHLFDNELQFDLLICSETIEHVAGIDNLLLEMKRVLKPNGTAIFTIPDVSVTHPVAFPGLFYPAANFVLFIEQYAWLVEQHKLYDTGWKTQCFKVRNAPLAEQRPIFPKHEAKFWGQPPINWTNL